jgi:adenylate cyclase class 2
MSQRKYIKLCCDMREIELKVRVSDLSPVRSRLGTLHAEFMGKVHERDVYYNAPDRDFGITDEALRVRYSSGTSTVTYKGAKISGVAIKAREELSTRVESGEVFEMILSGLGYTRTAVVAKWREYYGFAGSSIALDEVEGLGSFVEIEIISGDEVEEVMQMIEHIVKELGVEGERTLSSYLELLLATRSGARS